MDDQPALARSGRAPRRDAVRNDAKIIRAARAVFSEQGPQANMEVIAARAGVGVGTIYRRFAGKDALLEAIARTFMDDMDVAAQAALQQPDPAVGLEGFLEFVGVFNAEKRRYAAMLTDLVGDGEATERTMSSIDLLTTRAVEAGVLSPGVRGTDIKALIVALRGVVTESPDADDTSWRRFLDIHLRGLGRRHD